MTVLTFILFTVSTLLFGKENLSTDLNGVEITYTYSNGMSFNLKYTPQGVKYRYLSGESPNEWWGPFPYKAVQTPNGEYFLGWYEKGFGDSITQLVNFQTKTLYGSGIIVKDGKANEHFQTAKIEKVSGLKK